MSAQLRTLLMPLAMATGAVFHDFFSGLNPLTPYLIFTMLFIPFCGVRISEMKITGLHASLIAFQLLVSTGVYLCLRPAGETLAQGAMICILAPTATSAVVVAGMLGANIAIMVSYSMLVNTVVAVAAPLFFSAIGTGAGIAFWESFWTILCRVIPILVLPFALALLLRHFTPRLADRIEGWRPFSFYLWLVALAIVTGRTVNFIMTQDARNVTTELWLAAIALVICLAQFAIGRKIGRHWGNTVAGGQSLGQKNTILAIWMAQSYLDPLSSVAPAGYVLWQNFVNSTQLWLRARRDSRQAASQSNDRGE